MKCKFLDKEQKYDGSQLHSHFGYENGVDGNSIVSFIGPAEVKEHLVDCEDRQIGDFISSKRMMHFIIEIFGGVSLREMVLWQRLFIVQITDFLREMLPKKGISVGRDGDDIFVDGEKFSVSIATLSPVSGLVHVGLNIEVGDNCPVKAIGFNEVAGHIITNSISFERKTAFVLMQWFVTEFESIQKACYKVKGVQ